MQFKSSTELGELKNSDLHIFCVFPVLVPLSFCLRLFWAVFEGIPLHLWFVFFHDSCVCVVRFTYIMGFKKEGPIRRRSHKKETLNKHTK